VASTSLVESSNLKRLCKFAQPPRTKGLTRMRAVVVTNPGPAEGLRVIDVPTPVVGPGEVRIAVAAATVNPVDIQTRAGVYHELGWVDQPEHTGLGWDVAGTVSAVGADVTASTPRMRVGMRVAALVPGVDKPLGAYADEVVASPDAVAAVPDGLDLVEAATVPLNGLTALQALDILGDPAGRRLLVTGAAGAVGGTPYSSPPSVAGPSWLWPVRRTVRSSPGEARDSSC